MSRIFFHENDLPDGFKPGTAVALDTETMGLRLWRDRLCLVQLSAGDGTAHLVRFPKGSDFAAPNLKKVLSDRSVMKIFHFARFDLGAILRYLGVACENVYCTRTASLLARTNAASHSLKSLCREYLDVEIQKDQQLSDWGAETLSEMQKKYAAEDVLYLHALREKMDALLEREGRKELAEACFGFLPRRAELDAAGFYDLDIFAH